MKRTILAILVAASVALGQSAPTAAVDGNRITFTVTAKGTAPFTYQWRKNGVALPGATSASYVIVSAKTTDSGNYSVTVANAAGTATSAEVTVTVTAASPSGVVVSVEVSTTPAP